MTKNWAKFKEVGAFSDSLCLPTTACGGTLAAVNNAPLGVKILRCSFLSSASTGEFVLLIRRCVFSVRGLCWAPRGSAGVGEYSNFLIGASASSQLPSVMLANVNYCPTDKKKISFNGPPTPNRTRTTITEYHLEHSIRVARHMAQPVRAVVFLGMSFKSNQGE